jgi:hypothetical protein
LEKRSVREASSLAFCTATTIAVAEVLIIVGGINIIALLADSLTLQVIAKDDGSTVRGLSYSKSNEEGCDKNNN